MIDVRQYTSQYELIRAQVIGARSASRCADRTQVCTVRGVGLALLLREGLPGWLKAVASLLREASHCAESPAGIVDLRPQSCALAAGSVAIAATPVHHHEIARLLANLVLSTRPAARTPPIDARRQACR